MHCSRSLTVRSRNQSCLQMIIVNSLKSIKKLSYLQIAMTKTYNIWNKKIGRVYCFQLMFQQLGWGYHFAKLHQNHRGWVRWVLGTHCVTVEMKPYETKCEWMVLHSKNTAKQVFSFHLDVFSFKVNYTLCDTCCVSTIHIQSHTHGKSI